MLEQLSMMAALDTPVKRTKTFHARNIENSDKLKSLLSYMSDCQWRTSRELRQATNMEAVNTAVNELRANGYEYKCKFINGYYRYRLRKLPRFFVKTKGKYHGEQ